MKKPLLAQGFGAEKPKISLPNPKAIRWFAELQRLVPYQENFALLPVGWGKDSKGPMLAEWQNVQRRLGRRVRATR